MKSAFRRQKSFTTNVVMNIIRRVILLAMNLWVLATNSFVGKLNSYRVLFYRLLVRAFHLPYLSSSSLHFESPLHRIVLLLWGLQDLFLSD